MRFSRKLRVTFFSFESSFGLLLLVNLTLLWGHGAVVSGLAVPATDSHTNLSGTIPVVSPSAQVALAATTTTATNHSIPASHPAVDVHFEHVATTGPPSTTHPGDEYQNDQGHHNHYNSHTYQHDGAHFAGASASSLISRDNCNLPSHWKGEWFQSGVVSPIMIDHKSMGDKGTCIERSGDKFLFYEKATNCYRCLVIQSRQNSNQQSSNVLQYKESPDCEDNRDSLDHLCMLIPGDATLYSLFRIDAQPEDCPFKGAPYTFTYNRGHGECKNPVSYIDTCTEPSRLRLRYESCPDIMKTESTVEELTCLGVWKDGSMNYGLGRLRLFGRTSTNEEAYRCFIFEKTKTGHNGYNVAISGDATCTGVSSATEGARALVLTKVVEKELVKCTFPPWMSSHHWHTLDGKMSAKLHHRNSTMHITEDSRRNSSSGQYSGHSSSSATHTGTFTGFGSVSGAGGGPLFSGGTRIVCQDRKDISDRHVAIVAHHTEGCKSESICMHIYRRDNHVTEVQMLRKSDHGMEDSDCFKSDALGPTLPYVTLVNPDAKAHRCPNLGKYMAAGGSPDTRRVVRDSCGPSGGQGAFHSVVVGCGNRATMEFHSKCDRQDPITSYECHGSWEENGTGYLIASPLSRSSTSARRYCFIYSEADEGLRVSSSSETCRRNVSPGVEAGVWAFNLTVDGQCAEAVTGASASFPKSCDLLISIGVLSSVILVTVSNFFLVSSSPSNRPSSTVLR
ncbi:uncharacterized protein LOC110860504 [Folsomia candida]|uniref:Uncharacterized protein n=1 Tax=Folsomia candida TaxID=158441 RepID=A0A226D5L0_FOLCA|nr:uncharacterized protein LOC110860504 [Folsomia candida]OXA40499.1 hypothetical protein Fcan01_24623 [Folsomia candida]